jgi:hypothetical protein
MLSLKTVTEQVNLAVMLVLPLLMMSLKIGLSLFLVYEVVCLGGGDIVSLSLSIGWR